MWKRILASERRNIYLFYVLTAAMNCWFIASNWLYFWTKYMTYGQLGWVDALGFGFATLLEIPSGAVADLLGKRKTILIGFVAGAIGIYIVTFSGSLAGIFIGWMITQLVYAFYSGAAEALAYDSLVDLKDEKSFDHVITRSSEIESYTGAIAMLIGGFLYTIDARLPHLLWGTSFLIGAVFAWFLIEPKVDTQKFSFRKYFKQLGIGFKELTHPELRKYIGFFFALVGVYFLYSWGFLRPTIATSFGFFSREQGIILPLLTLYGALIVRSLPYFQKRLSGLKGLLILSAIMAVGFYLASLPLGYYGLIPLILIATAGRLAIPWISIVINRRIESKNRATTLSTVALITKIPYVLFGVLAAKMVENAQLSTLNRSIAYIIIVVAVVGGVWAYFNGHTKKVITV